MSLHPNHMPGPGDFPPPEYEDYDEEQVRLPLWAAQRIKWALKEAGKNSEANLMGDAIAKGSR
jgi:hypothetical protein